ncbi:MAG: DNA polymerase III subunit alpha [Gammaproteobacteria bacterium]
MSQDFIHLRVHSEYSLVDSVIRIPDLVDRVARLGMPAVAITDESNLFAMIKFYRAAENRGVKPIIGADVWVESEQGNKPHRLTLLCRDRGGYLNLSDVMSQSYRRLRHDGLPVILREQLADNAAGLIALSGGTRGEIGSALTGGKEKRARRALEFWKSAFGDAFYLELQRTGREMEDEYLHAAVQLASSTATPLVATNDARFNQLGDFEAHEARVCIHVGRTLNDVRRPRNYSDQQYLKSAEEMQKLFSDLPEAIANTIEIAKRCNLELTFGNAVLPHFPVPDGFTTASYLRHEAKKGLQEKFLRVLGQDAYDDPGRQKPYQERLETELQVIEGMGFPGYFLVVADFIDWARKHDIPVGPGRGSGAGSLVAFSLGITNLDPLKYDLLFERFLNPERVSMPDFDIDFCMEGRDSVIEYVAGRYGRDHVSQIITFGTMAARAVVRDVGRVLGHPYGYVDRIAKLIPFEIGMTLEKALVDSSELRELFENDEEVSTLIDLAMALEGLARNAGKHAGGVVIAPGPLTEYTPLYSEEDGSSTVTQLDKDDVEAIGLVKFDFLGLRTLTIIDRAVKLINARREEGGVDRLDMTTLPLNDARTFRLLKDCRSTAVFQLESRGMKDLIRRLQPDSFEDIIALVALFRPGPLQSGMVDDFIARKHGAEVRYPHPALKTILRPTYGVILYQEQVMQIAQELAGYSLGSADLLRRAMGKKKAEEMAKQRAVFLHGSEKRAIEPRVANSIFDLMEKFAGYGFNKSHSAAYALLSYQTAWLKAHYPAAFMSAVLSADMDHTDKIVIMIDECTNMDLQVHSPSINHSQYAFVPASDNAIMYGLGAIKGVGQGAIEFVLNEREANGEFIDLSDFCHRIDSRLINKRVIESLIKAGAFDCVGPNRASLLGWLPEIAKLAEQNLRASEAGQDDMFGLDANSEGVAHSAVNLIEVNEWRESERLVAEKEALGLYLTGHPIESYTDDIARISTGRIVHLLGESTTVNGEYAGQGYQTGRQVKVIGLIVDLRRRGNRLTLTLDDRTGRIEASMFEETFEKYRPLIAKDRIVVVGGRLGYDEFVNANRIRVSSIERVEDARETLLRALRVRWSSNDNGSEFVPKLKSAIAPFQGGHCRILVHYEADSATGDLPLGDEWRVKPTEELFLRLTKLFGEGNVERIWGRQNEHETVN